MPFNKRSFFLAATAIELALLLGYGRCQYTGKCINVINTTQSRDTPPPARHEVKMGSPLVRTSQLSHFAPQSVREKKV